MNSCSNVSIQDFRSANPARSRSVERVNSGTHHLRVNPMGPPLRQACPVLFGPPGQIQLDRDSFALDQLLQAA